MLGFAVVEQDASADRVVVWLTSRESSDHIGHTNAVTIAADGPKRSEKMRSLLADRVVVTSGSGSGIPVEQLDGLLDEVEELRESLRPSARATLPARPQMPALGDIADPKTRALTTANYVVAVWKFWLTTGEKLRSLAMTRERAVAKSEGRLAEKGEGRCADLPPIFAGSVQPTPVR